MSDELAPDGKPWGWRGSYWAPKEKQMNDADLLSNLANKIDEALEFIKNFAGNDGAHHKQWVLDQIVHILADDYDKWVREFEDGEDGPRTYEWDDGIAP